VTHAIYRKIVEDSEYLGYTDVDDTGKIADAVNELSRKEALPDGVHG